MLSLSNTSFLKMRCLAPYASFTQKRNIRHMITLQHETIIPKKLTEKQLKVLNRDLLNIKPPLLTELKGGTLVITINRQAASNALDNDVLEDLSETMDDVYVNPEIKAVVITGAGEKAFAAGADILELGNLEAIKAAKLSKRVHKLFNKIEKSPKPILAAVNGFALGGGLELALCCHLIISSENASYGLPEAGLGLIPAYGGTQRLTYRIGKAKALELMMTGDKISANEAKDLRLVNHVVPLSKLLDKSIEIAHKIQTKAPLAISKVIACANEAEQANPEGFKNEIKHFGECFATQDRAEGINAFLMKRIPNFNGE